MRASLSALLLLIPAVAPAQEPEMSPEIPPEIPMDARACVDVEVNGERVPDYDCLGTLLAPRTQDGAPAHVRHPSLASEEIAGRPSSSLGLFNREATRQRMGNTFGTSIHPQRPPPPPPTAPIRRP